MRSRSSCSSMRTQCQSWQTALFSQRIQRKQVCFDVIQPHFVRRLKEEKITKGAKEKPKNVAEKRFTSFSLVHKYGSVGQSGEESMWLSSSTLSNPLIVYSKLNKDLLEHQTAQKPKEENISHSSREGSIVTSKRGRNMFSNNSPKDLIRPFLNKTR